MARSLKGASVGYNFYTPVPGSKLYSELLESKKLSSIANLDDFAEMDGFEHLFENFTKVSTKELHVIKNYIRLRGILTPTSNSNSEQIIKVVLSVAESWLGRGFIHFAKSFTYTAFSTVKLFSIFFYPSIRKKYELYFLKKV